MKNEIRIANDGWYPNTKLCKRTFQCHKSGTTTVGTTTLQNETKGNICDKVRKWKRWFDRQKFAINFMELLEELTIYYELTGKQLLRALPELLNGQALLWYRNNVIVWNFWEYFSEDFKAFHLKSQYYDKLEDDIRKRTQHAADTVKDYIIDIQTLIRRHQGYNPTNSLEIIYKWF